MHEKGGRSRFSAPFLSERLTETREIRFRHSGAATTAQAPYPYGAAPALSFLPWPPPRPPTRPLAVRQADWPRVTELSVEGFAQSIGMFPSLARLRLTGEGRNPALPSSLILPGKFLVPCGSHAALCSDPDYTSDLEGQRQNSLTRRSNS